MGTTAQLKIHPAPVPNGPFRPAHRRRCFLQLLEPPRLLWRNDNSARDRSLRDAIDRNRKGPMPRPRRSHASASTSIRLMTTSIARCEVPATTAGLASVLRTVNPLRLAAPNHGSSPTPPLSAAHRQSVSSTEQLPSFLSVTIRVRSRTLHTPPPQSRKYIAPRATPPTRYLAFEGEIPDTTSRCSAIQIVYDYNARRRSTVDQMLLTKPLDDPTHRPTFVFIVRQATSPTVPISFLESRLPVAPSQECKNRCSTTLQEAKDILAHMTSKIPRTALTIAAYKLSLDN